MSRSRQTPRRNTAESSIHASPETGEIPFTVRDWVAVTAALAVILYGVLLLGCGGGNESTKSEEDPRNTANPAAGGEPAGPETVRFSLDEGGVEMAVPMERYQPELSGGSPAAATSAVASGDWFLENFAYEGNRLVAVTAPPITDSVVLAARHKKYDAEIVVWTETQRPQDAERYLDAIADDWIERIKVSRSLLDAIAFDDMQLQELQTVQDATEPNLEGLHFGKVALAGRSALQVDMLRIQPGTRVRQHIQMVMLRQYANESTVLVFAAIAARRDDMPDLQGELAEFASQMVLKGQGLPLALNPNRELGPAGDEYGVDWQLVLEGQTAEPDAVDNEMIGYLPTDFINGISMAVKVGLPESRTRLFGSPAGDETDGQEPEDAGNDEEIEDEEPAATDEEGVEGADPIPDDELPDVDPEGVDRPRGL